MIRQPFISFRFIRVFIFFFPIVLLSVSTYSQNSNNPFEIKNRIDNVSISEETLPIVTTTKTVQDSVTQKLPMLEVQRVVANDKAKTSYQLESNSKNPFEVNHIPLRRKDVLKNTTEVKNSIKNATPPSKAFIYWVTTLSLMLLTLATASNTKLLAKVTKSIFNENILKLEQRTRTSHSLEYILLYIIFILNASIFALLLWNHFGGEEIKFTSFAKCVGLITIIYIIRHLSNYLFGAIFNLEKETSLYSFTIQVFNAFIGVVLIPFNLFLAFGPDKLHDFTLLFSLSIVAILLIIRYMRGITISINYIFNNLILFFIYLCSLEIAPILILVKVFSKH